jgi:hypothetical protein
MLLSSITSIIFTRLERINKKEKLGGLPARVNADRGGTSNENAEPMILLLYNERYLI